HHWHELAEQIGAVAHLLAVHGAVPGRPPMNELIAHRIQAVEDFSQEQCGVAAAQGKMRTPLAALETFFPILLRDSAGLPVPETLEHIRRIEQYPDAAGELAPDEVVDTFLFVEITQFGQETPERGLFGEPGVIFYFGGVRRVESDPEKDETPVHVVGQRGALPPAERAMNPEVEIGGIGVTHKTVTLLEGIEIHSDLLVLLGCGTGVHARSPRSWKPCNVSLIYIKKHRKTARLAVFLRSWGLTCAVAAAGRCSCPWRPRPPCRSTRPMSGAGGSSCRCRPRRPPSRSPAPLR